MPTAGISLVRENTLALRPPRALWVPFELGRPFGVPGDAAFQARVLRALLALFERGDGPVVLADYPEEAPAVDEAEMAGWTCPIPLPRDQAQSGDTALDALLSEVTGLAPWQAVAAEERGRSSVGLTGLDIEAVVRFLHAFRDSLPGNPVPDVSLGEAFRLACEDLKAFYHEAARAQPGRVQARPSSRALADWFWGETAAGRLLLSLHPICTKSADEGVRLIASSQLVPRAQRYRL